LKIIYLFDEFPSKRDCHRFGFGRVINRGIDLECWIFLSKKPDDCFFQKNVKYFEIKVLEELENESHKLIKAFVFDHRAKSYDVYTKSWFKNQGAYLVESKQGELPVWRYKSTIRDKYILSNKSIKTIFSKIVKRYRASSYSDKVEEQIYDIKICGGECDCSNIDLCIQSHSRDYDLFLSIGKSSNNKKNIIFLDSGMTTPQGFIENDIKPHCTSTRYYNYINKFFDQVESELSMPVIIAAHPSGDVDYLVSQHDGRQVKQSNTAELVRDAEIVIAHDSTAISFAVLWEKPLLITTTDELESNNYMSMEATSKAFGIKRINIDHLVGEYDWNALSKEPIKKYSEYKRKYIKAEGTPEKNSWEIFIDEIKKYDRVNSV